MHKYFILIIAFFLLENTSAQSGWTKGKGEFYGQFLITHFSSDQYYNFEGVEMGNNTFVNDNILLYGEYGVTNRLTATINGPLLVSNRFITTRSVIGVGDIALGAKFRLLKNYPLSIHAEAEIPTDDGILLSDAKEANVLGTFDQINLPSSDGELNFRTTIATSQASKNGKLFYSIYGSINWRTQGFTHQYRLGGELGYSVLPKFMLIGKMNIQESLGEASGSKGSIFYGEGTTFTSAGLTALYSFSDHYGITFNFYNYNGLITTRQNIYAGSGIGLGFFVKY